MAQYYLVINRYGRQQCISQSATDLYVNDMQIDCSQNITIPIGLTRVRDIQIFCTNDLPPARISATVYKK